jgi:hypothetical protein
MLKIKVCSLGKTWQKSFPLSPKHNQNSSSHSYAPQKQGSSRGWSSLWIWNLSSQNNAIHSVVGVRPWFFNPTPICKFASMHTHPCTHTFIHSQSRILFYACWSITRTVNWACTGFHECSVNISHLSPFVWKPDIQFHNQRSLISQTPFPGCILSKGREKVLVAEV